MRDLRAFFLGVVAACGAAPGCSATHGPPGDAGALPTDGDDTGAAVDAGCEPQISHGSCSIPGVVTYGVGCGLPTGLAPGPHPVSVCTRYCPQDVGDLSGCTAMAQTSTSPAMIYCFHTGCVIDGRRPEGYAHPLPDPSQSAAQAWLVASAAIEHASVTAFRHLAHELSALGAPPDLVARAFAAADEEVQHAAAKCDLARRRGVAVTLPDVATPPVRDLAALARENVVEGCVRETWGALLATWQGAHAADVTARAALATIAVDESRHAELAWDVDDWARSRLPADEVGALDAARAEAVEALGREALGAHDRTLREDFGAPGPSDAARLFGAARAALWS